MDYAKESLRLHKEWGGKIEVITKVPVETNVLGSLCDLSIQRILTQALS